MPQYDYRCQDCQQTYTIEKAMSDNSNPTCLTCGSTNASRIWNMFIRAGSITTDIGQGQLQKSSATKSGCRSCSSHSCASCH